MTKVERGERRVDSMSVLLELSRALAVPLHQLTGRLDHTSMPAALIDGVEGLRRVLDRPARFAAADVDNVPVPATQLQAQAATLRRLYNGGREFAAAVPALTGLIEAAQRTTATASGGDLPVVQSALANLYRLASLRLRQLGDFGRARLAIDRAVLAAEHADDDLLLASVAASMTVQLMVQGDPEDAVALALATVDHLRRSRQTGGPTYLVVHGALHLYGAQAAARLGDAAEAARLLDQADGIAGRLGIDAERHCIIFGPTNVAIQTAGMLVDLERPAEAIRVALPVRPETLGSSNRPAITIFIWLGLTAWSAAATRRSSLCCVPTARHRSWSAMIRWRVIWSATC